MEATILGISRNSDAGSTPVTGSWSPAQVQGNVKQMPFSVVNLFQIRIVRDRFDSLLLRNYLIVASHHYHGSEFQDGPISVYATFHSWHNDQRDPCQILLSIFLGAGRAMAAWTAPSHDLYDLVRFCAIISG